MWYSIDDVLALWHFNKVSGVNITVLFESDEVGNVAAFASGDNSIHSANERWL